MHLSIQNTGVYLHTVFRRTKLNECLSFYDARLYAATVAKENGISTVVCASSKRKPFLLLNPSAGFCSRLKSATSLLLNG